MSNRQRTQFVVSRLNWRKVGRVDVRLPGSTRLASFPDAPGAEAECRRLEVIVRATVNPFACGQAQHERSSFDEGRLRDWMLDAGLTPPEDSAAWVKWWQEENAAMTELQRERVWQGCDKVRFHEVAECPARRLAYVVVGINWHYTDQNFCAGAEGGLAMRAFSTREKAEEYARQVTITERLRYTTDEPFEMEQRMRVQSDPLGLNGEPIGLLCFTGSVEDVPMFEVVEVEVED